MTYQTEEEFLKDYNPNNYDRISLTTDILVLSISDEKTSNYRKTDKKHMSVLLVKRKDYPFKDMWCIPGGFLEVGEELEDCPKRILEKETGLKNIFLEQLYTFGGVNRDPRMRILSTAYMSLIDKDRLDYQLKENAKWFNISYSENNNIISVLLTSEDEKITFQVKKVLEEKTTDRYKFEIVENKDLAFDHPLVILTGIERLKNKINYTDIVFHMMPKVFTLKELQNVYEVILNKKLLDPAFRRIIKNKVEKTDQIKTGEGHRPSVMFRYKNHE